MGAVSDRLQLSLTETKAYLRVDGNEDDVLIGILVDAAKEAADLYLNNPFIRLDEFGIENEFMPADVKLWCLQRVARSYERRTEGLAAEAVSGLGSNSYGAEDYSLIQRYRFNPGF